MLDDLKFYHQSITGQHGVVQFGEIGLLPLMVNIRPTCVDQYCYVAFTLRIMGSFGLNQPCFNFGLNFCGRFTANSLMAAIMLVSISVAMIFGFKRHPESKISCTCTDVNDGFEKHRPFLNHQVGFLPGRATYVGYFAVTWLSGMGEVKGGWRVEQESKARKTTNRVIKPKFPDSGFNMVWLLIQK